MVVALPTRHITVDELKKYRPATVIMVVLVVVKKMLEGVSRETMGLAGGRGKFDKFIT